jgi:hypothetical protein
MRTASDSPVLAEPWHAQRSVARCEPCASAHPKFTRPQSVKAGFHRTKLSKMLEPAGAVQGACEGLKLGTFTRPSVLALNDCACIWTAR